MHTSNYFSLWWQNTSSLILLFTVNKAAGETLTLIAFDSGKSYGWWLVKWLKKGTLKPNGGKNNLANFQTWKENNQSSSRTGLGIKVVVLYSTWWLMYSDLSLSHVLSSFGLSWVQHFLIFSVVFVKVPCQDKTGICTGETQYAHRGDYGRVGPFGTTAHSTYWF